MKNLVRKIKNNRATVGVIGLGYVGLPLLKAFWDSGFSVLGFDVDQSKIDKLLRRGELSQAPGEGFCAADGVQSRDPPGGWSPTASNGRGFTSAGCHFRGSLRRHRRLRPPGRGRRHHRLRAHAAGQAPRAGPVLHREDRRRHRRDPAAGAAGRAGIDHLSGHHPRGHAAATSKPTGSSAAGFLPRLFARARRPRPQGSQHADHSQARRRHRPGQRASWRRRSIARPSSR